MCFLFAVVSGVFLAIFSGDLGIIRYIVFFAFIATISLCYHTGWLTLKHEDRDSWLRRIAIAFAAIGGKSFYRANLTRTDFTRTKLKNTNFNQAKLCKTVFHNAVELELARPGKTLLANRQVRESLVHPSNKI